MGEPETEVVAALAVREIADSQLNGLWPQKGLKAAFLDYDGTLREFEPRPELAVPTPELQRLLAAFSAREDVLVYIISGRDARFLSTHFGEFPRIKLIAEHERQMAGRFQVWRGGEPLDECVWKQPVREAMTEVVATVAGSHVEEKTSSLVWHYRGVTDETHGDRSAASLSERLHSIIESTEHLADVRVSIGQKTVEVAQHSDTKGEVMRRICEDATSSGQPFQAVLAAGDDVSDESMFESAPRGSLTVKVGPEGMTCAGYRAADPAEFRALLWRLVG
jgi:trehalose 6-phosphate synthase/phosphatase